MIEGTRYKVHLLLLWLKSEPSCGGCLDTDKTPRACTVSGVNAIRAIPSQSSHGIMSDFCKRSILASLVRSFSSRVDLDLQASRMFRPTLHEKKMWSNRVLSYFVRTVARE